MKSSMFFVPELTVEMQAVYDQACSRSIRAGETLVVAHGAGIADICWATYEAAKSAGKSEAEANAAAQAANDAFQYEH